MKDINTKQKISLGLDITAYAIISLIFTVIATLIIFLILDIPEYIHELDSTMVYAHSSTIAGERTNIFFMFLFDITWSMIIIVPSYSCLFIVILINAYYFKPDLYKQGLYESEHKWSTNLIRVMFKLLLILIIVNTILSILYLFTTVFNYVSIEDNFSANTLLTKIFMVAVTALASLSPLIICYLYSIYMDKIINDKYVSMKASTGITRMDDSSSITVDRSNNNTGITKKE